MSKIHYPNPEKNGRMYSRWICPACEASVRSTDEVKLHDHPRKGGELCPGSGASVAGLHRSPKDLAILGAIDPDTGQPLWRETVCQDCQAPTWVEVATGTRYPHVSPRGSYRCAWSGTWPKRGTHLPTPKGVRDVRELKECHECGQFVKVNSRYGIYYDHSDANGAKCGASGAPAGAGDKNLRIDVPSIRNEIRTGEQPRPIDTTRSSSSVRAISGGLPGSNRRRS